MEYIVKYKYDKENNEISKEKYRIFLKESRDNGAYSLFTDKTLYFDCVLNSGCLVSIPESKLRKSLVESEPIESGVKKVTAIYCYEDGLMSEIENDKFVKRCFLRDVEIEKREAKYIYEEQMKKINKKETEVLAFFDKECERTVSECFRKDTEEKENLEEER